jgi:hypothetical protein
MSTPSQSCIELRGVLALQMQRKWVQGGIHFASSYDFSEITLIVQVEGAPSDTFVAKPQPAARTT